MPLEPEDQRHLTAAHGYLELAMPLEANEELEQIDPNLRHVPEVLAVRVEIYRTLESWELMQTVARKLAEYEPTSTKWSVALAFALRKSGAIDAAKQILRIIADAFPEVAAIQYELACVESQMGEIDSARDRLKKAFELDAELRSQALIEADLEPLWKAFS